MFSREMSNRYNMYIHHVLRVLDFSRDCYCDGFQKYITTVQKSVNSTEQQRAIDAAKNKKMAGKEVCWQNSSGAVAPAFEVPFSLQRLGAADGWMQGSVGIQTTFIATFQD